MSRNGARCECVRLWHKPWTKPQDCGCECHCECPGPLDPPYASTWGHYDGPQPCPLAGPRHFGRLVTQP